MKRIGIVSFAHMHAHSYAAAVARNPEAQLAAIWDEEETRGREAARQYGGTYYRCLEDMLLSAQLEAVIVCSENARHCEHVMAAARAGIHVLCEKPLATDIRQAEEMVRYCAERGIALSVAYPVRHAYTIRKLKEMIEEGAFGDIVAVHGTNRGKKPGGWFIDAKLSGGGAAIDHIVHLADIYRYLLAAEAKRVYAELDTAFGDTDVEDCGIVMIEFDNGVLATIDPSWSRPDAFPTWGDFTLEIVGTRLSATLDVMKQSSVLYGSGAVEWKLWLDDVDQAMIDAFIGCLSQGAVPLPMADGHAGLQSLKIVKAAYRSNAESRYCEMEAGVRHG
ncbi:Gfo/Idh/MocA family protein [Paenibacillus cymbidii]|uniref:Gfo/Idh/MocA family protein n=1 Tax=Paenibacillus cymbidii TaxID=1639034 RepID=UPI0010805627|nr:Gfo/Idh/MocA family oxidoreductase [Paenibacillus cymbidii]